MSEDRYAYGYEVPLNVPTQSIPVITDTLNGKQYYSLRQVVELLNEMNEDIQYLNAFLVEQGLAEKYIRWKGDDDE